MGVVGHDDATKEHGHYPGEMETLSKEVRTESKQEPHGKFQRVVLTEIDKLEKLEEEENQT